MAEDEVGWLTVEVEDEPSWSSLSRQVYLPFPRAIVRILEKRHPDFAPKKIDADIDEFGQWRVSMEADYYGQLKFKWTGVGVTFEDAQRALVKYMDGWWFEADL